MRVRVCLFVCVGERARFPLRNDVDSDDDFVEGTEKTKTTVSKKERERKNALMAR